MADKDQRIKLLCELSKANSLQKITDLTYTLMGNPIFISDMAHTMLAYTKCVDINDSSWQKHVVNSQLERNVLKQEREVSTAQGASTLNRMPVIVNDDDLPFPRIIKTLVSDGRAIGIMVLTSYLQKLDEDDVGLMELISSFVIPILKKDRFFAADSNKSVENYFIKLLDGAALSCEWVNKRLEILGWKRLSLSYVLAFCFEQESEAGPESLLPILQSFSAPPHCCAFLYNNIIVCIYSSAEEIHNWDTQHLALSQLLDHWNLVAGVSRRFVELSEVREHYLEAVHALEIGRALGRKHHFYVYDYFAIFHMFQELPSGSVMQYCSQRISDLAEYDSKHNTQLCITLQVYLENSRSLARTADILYIHRNTVHYRINKCTELLYSSLEDGNESFCFILSLRILEYERKLRGIISSKPGSLPPPHVVKDVPNAKTTRKTGGSR